MLAHKYEARGAHRELRTMRDRELLISGPAWTGADRACLEKMVTCALKYPGFKGLIVRKVEKDLVTSAISILKAEVLPELLAARKVEWINGNKQDPSRYQFRNGSSIVITGLDNPSKISGSRYDMVYVNMAKELDLEDWQSLILVLLGNTMGYNQLLASTWPDARTHWLKLRCEAGKTAYLESRHEDNPLLYESINGDLRVTEYGRDVLARLSDLTGIWRSRNGMGLWAIAEGVILDKFDATVHMMRPFKVPEDWAHLWVIDFGFDHPFYWGNWVRAPDGALVEIQEIYYTKRTPRQHAMKILEVTEGQMRPEKIICDHDAAGRKEIEDVLSEAWGYPVYTVPAKKSVKIGIEKLQKRIKHHDIIWTHGALIERDPALARLGYPTCAVEEIPSYIWADESQLVPVKKWDDGMDGARYLVMEEDTNGGMDIEMRR
jgi:hypothetical protein